ncbi:AraC family transcriptional regulator [Piscinibacter sp. HJYY11]|uniref:helix-turn-helix domain-containing protein n=1 Tax=Piscinibacter sp. HJYY11 TaxID=2801333 RepID=UPI00191E8415|nr:helix-turn-helix domain-containing protein [Piscinibacter sp. HJYY11]MBL0727983.1 helix-turn-helix domain-containing protein [Piscinibacter sp. HJYY11]
MSDRLFLRLPEDELHGPEAGPMPQASLQPVVLHAALRGHVADMLLYHETVPRDAELIERVVPDGHLRLVFNFGDAPSTAEAPGLVAGVIGPSAAPSLVRLRGRMHAFSLTLRPGAATALLGVPAGEFNGAAVPLDAIWGREGADLQATLADERSDAGRARVLQRHLLRRVQGLRRESPARQVDEALRLLARTDAPTSMADIAGRLGCGERRLQQLFHAHVGLPPRTWRRLLRLQVCLRRLREVEGGPPDWAGLAADCGFYDQPHLANEFRALCGLSPTDYWCSTIAGSSKTPA